MLAVNFRLGRWGGARLLRGGRTIAPITRARTHWAADRDTALRGVAPNHIRLTNAKRCLPSVANWGFAGTEFIVKSLRRLLVLDDGLFEQPSPLEEIAEAVGLLEEGAIRSPRCPASRSRVTRCPGPRRSCCSRCGRQRSSRSLAQMAIFSFAWRRWSWSHFGWIDLEIWGVYAMSSWPVIGSLAASSTFCSY
jgi:hypothetical protein